MSESCLAIEMGPRGHETSDRLVGASGSGRKACALVVEGVVEGALESAVRGAAFEGASLASRLARAGFEVRACQDGLAALDAFIRELPDLIVTRDRLEGLDGFELVRRVREVSDVPIVLVGTAGSSWRRERALRMGVDRVVSEPGEVELLPQLALALADPTRPPRLRPRLTAAHVRRVARSELQAELARLLVDCRGNLAEMARRMGKDRSTVRYHLRRFGMLVEERAHWADERAGEGPPDDVSASA